MIWWCLFFYILFQCANICAHQAYDKNFLILWELIKTSVSLTFENPLTSKPPRLLPFTSLPSLPSVLLGIRILQATTKGMELTRVDISWMTSGASKLHKGFFYIEQLWTIDPFDVLAPQKLEDIFKMVAFFWLCVFAQIVVFVVSFDFEVWGISSTQKLDDPILQFSFKKGRVCVGVNNKHRMYVNQFQVWVCPNMWLEFFCCSDLGHGNISQRMDGLSCLTSSSSLIFGILGSIVKTREPGKPPA